MKLQEDVVKMGVAPNGQHLLILDPSRYTWRTVPNLMSLEQPTHSQRLLLSCSGILTG